MSTKIRKQGEGKDLRVPETVEALPHLRENGGVELEFLGDAFTTRPTRSPTPQLARLLSGVSPGNLHEAVSEGGPVGRETW